MDNHLPELPTEPVPAVHQPRKRRRAWLLALLGLIGLLVLCLVVALSGNLVGSPVSPSGHAKGAQETQSVQQGAPGTAGSLATPPVTQTAASTAKGTPGATPQIGRPGVTYGRPHLGGPLSDFVGKYGQPTDQGDAGSQNFWIGADQTIDINVLTNTLGEVTQLTVLGPDTWDAQQAEGYCVQFLPDKAVQVSATATQREYHSSVGTVMLTLQARSCLLALARS